MRKKRFISLLAAVCLTLSIVGCKQNDDVSTGQEQTSAVSNSTILPKVKEEETESESEIESETTTAPQNAEINIETLAEGEERDYNIEDILKNDLEIDGIPISIPCTLNELLETLGDNYSVDKSEIKDSFSRASKKDKVTKSKYFTGKFVTAYLDYKNGEEEYICGHFMTICDPKKFDFDTVNVIGYSEMGGKLTLDGLSAGDDVDKFIEKYGKPNKINVGEESTGLIYEDDDCRIAVMVENQNSNVINSFLMTFATETE